MAEELVRLDTRGNAVVLTLNQPERKNPLSDPMIRAVTAALEGGEVRAAGLVVFTGAGETFSAGGDISQFHAALSTDANEQFEGTEDFSAMLLALEQVSAVTMAAVRGGAFGGGCGLTAACDFAIASTTAQFALPEIRLGAFPMLISPALVRAIGYRATMALGVSGEKISAEEARNLGLVSTVIEEPEFDTYLDRFLHRANEVPAQVLRMGKKSVRAGLAPDYKVGLDSGATLRSLLFASPAFHEGVSAFVDRSQR